MNQWLIFTPKGFEFVDMTTKEIAKDTAMRNKSKSASKKNSKGVK